MVKRLKLRLLKKIMTVDGSYNSEEKILSDTAVCLHNKRLVSCHVEHGNTDSSITKQKAPFNSYSIGFRIVWLL